MLQFLHQWGSLGIGICAAVLIVIGAHMALKSSNNPQQTTAITRIFAFGTGAFFTAVCLDFLPDAWSAVGTQTPYWLFLGAFMMWLMTHLSDGVFDREQRLVAGALDSRNPVVENPSWNTTLRFTPMSAVIVAAALSFHTFLEGVAVSLAFQHLTWSTLVFSLAVILHKLPEGVLWGLALATVFPQQKEKIKRILVIPAICTIVGVWLGVFLTQQSSTLFVKVATGLVAGAMFYISFAELLPSLREMTEPRLTRYWFVIGLSAMFVLNVLPTVFQF